MNMNTKLKKSKKSNVKRIVKVIAETWLPCFPGFYNSCIDIDFDYELESINQNRSDNGLIKDVIYDDLEYDFKKYMNSVSKDWTEIVESKLKELGLVKSIKFENVESPREYNFRTDEVNCKIEYYPAKLMKFIKANREAIEEYIHDKHTSRDGFISFQSNDLDEWIADLDNFKKADGYKTGAILEACLLAQYDNWTGAIWDIRDEMPDFENHVSDCITNWDLLDNGVRCSKCGKLYLGNQTEAYKEYSGNVLKQTVLYKEIVGHDPKEVKEFAEVYPEVCCEDCE